jgi:hypothetical protein
MFSKGDVAKGVEDFKMRQRVRIVLIGAFLCMSSAWGAFTVNFGSGDGGGNGTLVNDPNQWNCGVGGLACTAPAHNLNITKNPGWNGPIAGSNWISIPAALDTIPGRGPTDYDTTNQNGTRVAGCTAFVCDGEFVSFFQAFYLGGSPILSSSLLVLADDTADVYLNGVKLYQSNPTSYPTCANVVIGCLTEYEYDSNNPLLQQGAANFNNALLAPGWNVLEIQTWQKAGTGFGLDYAGSVSVVPEPGFYGVLALGLSGLCLAIRRKRSA